MKVLVLVIVSFDKPVYYDMLAVWKKRINYQSLTEKSNTDGCINDVWFIHCKPAMVYPMHLLRVCVKGLCQGFVFRVCVKGLFSGFM